MTGSRTIGADGDGGLPARPNIGVFADAALPADENGGASLRSTIYDQEAMACNYFPWS
jgi:hypothetical protein